MSKDQVSISAQDGRTHVLSLVTKSQKELGPVIAGLIAKSEEVDAGPITVLSAFTTRSIPKGLFLRYNLRYIPKGKLS